jgi:hypothetical protein
MKLFDEKLWQITWAARYSKQGHLAGAAGQQLPDAEQKPIILPPATCAYGVRESGLIPFERE